MNPIASSSTAALGRLSASPGIAPSQRRRRDILRSRLTVSTAGFGLAVLLAACGASAASSPAATGAASAAGGAAGGAGAAAAAGPTTTTAAGGPNRAGLQAYRTCLSQHGVTLPTRPARPATGASTPADGTVPANPTGNAGGGFGGGFGGGGFGGGLQAVLADPANKAAVDACKSLAPTGGFGTGGFGTGGRRGQALQAYFSCLSDNGVAVPTTVAGGPPPSIDRTTPAFTAANQKCQVLLPQRTANSSTTSTTTVVGG
jgi:hypothetical protein